MNNVERYKAGFEALVELGERMQRDLMRSSGEDEDAVTKVTVRLLQTTRNGTPRLRSSSSNSFPGRLAEFEQLYKGDGRRKKIDAATFTIQDWLRGFQSPRKVGGKIFDDFTIVTMQFVTQLNILKSVGARFDSSLFDIRQLVQADLFDSELGAARELANRGFLRAAGSGFRSSPRKASGPRN